MIFFEGKAGKRQLDEYSRFSLQLRNQPGIHPKEKKIVAKVYSSALFGIEAYPVEVEVDLARGLPKFSIVGLPDAAVKEARERVSSAIKNSSFTFPTKKITVNLAPPT